MASPVPYKFDKTVTNLPPLAVHLSNVYKEWSAGMGKAPHLCVDGFSKDMTLYCQFQKLILQPGDFYPTFS